MVEMFLRLSDSSMNKSGVYPGDFEQEQRANIPGKCEIRKSPSAIQKSSLWFVNPSW